MKKLLLLVAAIALSGCAPLIVQGRVGFDVPVPIIVETPYYRPYYEQPRWHYLTPTRRSMESVYYGH